jgi:hypothetical protein
MTLPSTGTTWEGAGLNDVDSRLQLYHGSGKVAVLVRDNRGAATNISPHDNTGAVGYSLLAEDGAWRTDLLADVLDEDGHWTENPDDNEGWYLLGAFGEDDGPTAKASIDIDDQMIEQSQWVYDSVVTKKDVPFSFTPIEVNRPVVRRLINDLPLSDSDGKRLVESVGAENAVWAKPVAFSQVDRQFMVLVNRDIEGRMMGCIDAYPLARLTDIGDSRYGKKGDAPELTFKPQPDSNFMVYQDGIYVPAVSASKVVGPAWAAMAAESP